MTRARWQHLDLARRPGAPGPTLSAPPEAEAPVSAAPGDSPLLQAARGYYHLHQFQACADILAEALADGTHLPGARRLLGLAFGQVGDFRAAAEALRLALEEDADDAATRASLLSAQLASGQSPVAADGDGELGELQGAAAWRRAQLALLENRAGQAALEFGAAARLFAASPADVLGERLAASYIGQAVSYLLAGQPEAAQQGFTRIIGRTRASESTLAFARRVYEVAEAIRDVPPEERESALAPLVELVLSAHLVVGFYDGVRPVALRWDGLV